MRTIAFVFLLGPSLAVADPFYFDIPPEQDVIILGEVHDNPLHHRNQAEVIAALQPAAVVFEMLGSFDSVLIRFPEGRAIMSIKEETDWDTSGWPPFQDYEPIFEALGEAWVYGAEVDRDVARRAMETNVVDAFDGAFSISNGADSIALGLDIELSDQEQETREALQQEAHCGMLPPDMLPDFVAVQRMRDAALAWAVLQAMEETYGPVIVITGNGHARTDWGLPSVLQRADPSLAVFSVGQIEGDQTDVPFDLIVTTPIQERPDPCAAFQN